MKLTNEEALAKLAQVHGGKITALEPYTGSQKRWKVQCECGHLWAPKANDLFSGYGCRPCGYKSNGLRLRLLPEEALTRLAEIHPQSHLWNHIPIESSNPGKCNVNAGIFGQQRLTIFSNNGTGCPKCAWKITLTHEEAVERLNSKHAGRIIPLENYVNTTMPWKVQCKCGHIWAPKANSLFTGCGCPKCAAKSNGEKSKLSHEEAVARLAEIHKGKITALEPYPGNDNPWKVQCACGHTWAPLPYILFGGHGCLKCGIKSTHEKQQLSADQANARL
jgi:hypothetical protein